MKTHHPGACRTPSIQGKGTISKPGPAGSCGQSPEPGVTKADPRKITPPRTNRGRDRKAHRVRKGGGSGGAGLLFVSCRPFAPAPKKGLPPTGLLAWAGGAGQNSADLAEGPGPNTL